MKRRIHRKKGLASRLADLPGGRLGIFLARNRPVLKSLAVFVGIILAFILALPVYRGFVNGPFSVAVANSTGFLLRVFGVGARATGTSVISPMFSVEVIPACSGIFAYILFLAAVLAYPCKLKAKATGIALGFPTILLAAVLRSGASAVLAVFDDRMHGAALVLLGTTAGPCAPVGPSCVSASG